MYEYECIIERVVDGDTAIVSIDLGFSTWLKNVSVRLLGINAPESRTSDLIEKIAGLKSKEYLSSLLPAGTKQIIRTTIDKEKFGRVLGDFFIDHPDYTSKASVCAKMVADGYAEFHKY